MFVYCVIYAEEEEGGKNQPTHTMAYIHPSNPLNKILLIHSYSDGTFSLIKSSNISARRVEKSTRFDDTDDDNDDDEIAFFFFFLSVSEKEKRREREKIEKNLISG